jgi:hypothetical protein
MLRKIFLPNMKEEVKAEENCIMRSFIICAIRQILLG